MTAPAPSVAALIDAEWAAFVRILDRGGEHIWTRPTRLAGWRVEDLARHVFWGITMEAEALAFAADGRAGRASGRVLHAPRAAIVEELGKARRELVDQLTAAATDAPLPLPYADVPRALAEQIFVMEAAVHRSDLAHAVDGSSTLTPAALPACGVVLQAFWPALAAGTNVVPPAGTAFRLLGDSLAVEAEFDGATWGPVTGDPAVEIRGSDESIVLFAYGRLSFDDAGVTATGDEALARRFKEFVPGPT